MEAARVAALRGHDVSLLEKSRKLGGLLPMASVVKGTKLEMLRDIVRYLKVQVKKLGVKIQHGKQANAITIERLKPDVVVLAIGGELTIPEIKGIDKPIVLTSPALHNMLKPFLNFLGPVIMEWLTKLWMPVGKRAIIIGSGLHGIEIAEFLVKRRRKVTIVDTAEKPGEGMLDLHFGIAMGWFAKQDVNTFNGVKDLEITDKGVSFVTKEGTKQNIEADTVITTSPLKANTSLSKALEGKVPEVYTIGDCKEPRMIVDAIADGWYIARNI